MTGEEQQSTAAVEIAVQLMELNAKLTELCEAVYSLEK